MKSTLRLVAGGGRSGGLPSFRIGAELGGDTRGDSRPFPEGVESLRSEDWSFDSLISGWPPLRAS